MQQPFGHSIFSEQWALQSFCLKAGGKAEVIPRRKAFQIPAVVRDLAIPRVSSNLLFLALGVFVRHRASFFLRNWLQR